MVVLQSTNGESRFGTLRPRTGKTSFIVNDKGYLQEIPGTTKISNAFVHQLPVTHKSPARWPQVRGATSERTTHASLSQDLARLWLCISD